MDFFGLARRIDDYRNDYSTKPFIVHQITKQDFFDRMVRYTYRHNFCDKYNFFSAVSSNDHGCKYPRNNSNRTFVCCNIVSNLFKGASSATDMDHYTYLFPCSWVSICRSPRLRPLVWKLSSLNIRDRARRAFCSC